MLPSPIHLVLYQAAHPQGLQLVPTPCCPRAYPALCCPPQPIPIIFTPLTLLPMSCHRSLKKPTATQQYYKTRYSSSSSSICLEAERVYKALREDSLKGISFPLRPGSISPASFQEGASVKQIDTFLCLLIATIYVQTLCTAFLSVLFNDCL